MHFGKYYQTPNYWKLLSPDNTRDLENSYTEQFIIGLEHFIDDDIRLTFEIYNKNILKDLFSKQILQPIH